MDAHSNVSDLGDDELVYKVEKYKSLLQSGGSRGKRELYKRKLDTYQTELDRRNESDIAEPKSMRGGGANEDKALIETADRVAKVIARNINLILNKLRDNDAERDRVVEEMLSMFSGLHGDQAGLAAAAVNEYQRTRSHTTAADVIVRAIRERNALKDNAFEQRIKELHAEIRELESKAPDDANAKAAKAAKDAMQETTALRREIQNLRERIEALARSHNDTLGSIANTFERGNVIDLIGDDAASAAANARNALNEVVTAAITNVG